jgi:hypothetical protein
MHQCEFFMKGDCCVVAVVYGLYWSLHLIRGGVQQYPALSLSTTLFQQDISAASFSLPKARISTESLVGVEDFTHNGLV